MSRYVDINKVLEELYLSHKDVIYIDKNACAERIKKIPSIDIVPKRGEWIWHEDEDICNCSECKFEIDATGCIDPMEYVGVFRYCPYCGADMRGKDDE